jgi:hypothetical protein
LRKFLTFRACNVDLGQAVSSVHNLIFYFGLEHLIEIKMFRSRAMHPWRRAMLGQGRDAHQQDAFLRDVRVHGARLDG